MKYQLVAAGGTFDHLHRGHRDFLNFILNLSDKVVLGLTSDTYVAQNKKDQGIEPFETRRKNLEFYLESINKRDHVEIVSIDDHFGPAITSEHSFDALAVTEETKKGGEEINNKRKEKGLSELPLEVFALTREIHGKPIASSSIRRVIFTLPVTLRILLQEPWGEILNEIPNNLDPDKTVTVGDVTTKLFLDKNIYPKLSIIDLVIERDHKVKNIQELGFTGSETIIRVKNHATSITPELMGAVQKSLEGLSKTLIIIEGEEDLAVLPVLLFVPAGFTIFYGQPGQGMVKVRVTDKIKKKAKNLLEKFDRKNSV